jgi:hypothetical protein
VRALRPYAQETSCKDWFDAMDSAPDKGNADAGTPAPPPAAANLFQPIIDKAVKSPEDGDGEKAWLLDTTFWMALLTTLPDAKRNLGGIPIGGMKVGST